ncbi:autophagy-related 9 [Trichoderma cornu-damae]|uniref:Autophagy-related protein 9 n=1 Tax=Trichoderma cornu-damae TaxID=654480 RepID=A0A9P8QHB8_9HYPO|nr:autophagy-related 9 [Trichoderma cornu-damae]
MTPKIFGRLGASTQGGRSFYEQLRGYDDEADFDAEVGLPGRDDPGRAFGGGIPAQPPVDGRRNNADGVLSSGASSLHGGAQGTSTGNRGSPPKWPPHDEGDDDDDDDDVPASLLVESNKAVENPGPDRAEAQLESQHHHSPEPSSGHTRARWRPPAEEGRLEVPKPSGRPAAAPFSSLLGVGASFDRRNSALWRWANITNLDSFMRDVYDYYEGGGMWCIMCSNALWLLETLFVAVLLTFLTQCVNYGKVPHSQSLTEVVVPRCTQRMSSLWSFGVWLYSFFFIWKSVQYFFEIRRLLAIREFFIILLDIPEQDMQTISWQDVVARIMALRDQNPRTATGIPQNLRRFLGSQSKERLDAHDIANRLMRKENYLIAMINKDLLNLSLPFPFLRGRQLFSKTMEWYLHYCILDMAFNELGQVQQDFLRAERRGVLSQKLKQRFYFAGLLNLLFAPIVLAYVIIVYFFTYYNEYQKDPKLAAARKYTSLAEWKFREFNELPHIFYERLHMSFPFATRYMDQFPKRMTEEIARSVAFMSGALTAILAVCTLLDSELFLSFEITKDRTALFYLGVFGGIWALTRGMVSEEATVFNPEYALRNVVEYTHYMPDHWQGRLHSFEVKQEFSELYKMKVVIFLEEVLGIITTPLLLLLSLPKCSDQIVDFFREFTVHVDGLGYVCSFAVFDFKKGPGQADRQAAANDVREDYYATKHGKMAASYYGFLDNYVINPKTGIPGHMPPGTQLPFHPPPAFPSLNSPTLAADMQASQAGPAETGRNRTRAAGFGGFPRGGHSITQPSPMASMLLDPRHQPSVTTVGGRGPYKPRPPRAAHRAEIQIPEEPFEAEDASAAGLGGDGSEAGALLGESMWQTSPGRELSKENSMANSKEPEGGVLGLINQLRQTQHHRRGGVF